MASRSIKNRPGIKKKHPSIGVLAMLAVVLAVIVSGGVGIYTLGQSWIGDLEDYDLTDAAALNTAEPSLMYASDGSTLLAKLQLENRDPVELGDISPYVLKGTIATEDERYYDHGGFDLMGIARALVVNITGSGREGASTITQQFVRNTILAEEMDDISIKRKVREMYLSVKMEEVYSKDEILRMYLNTINYGNATYGIQAASQRYFSKNATDLTLAEAAALVGIPQSPSSNNPVASIENCTARRNVVLQRMLKNGYINQEEHDAAQAEELVLNETLPTGDGLLKYEYFASYVRNLLTDPDGPFKYSTNEVLKGGLTIVTTLDTTMQQAAEAAVAAKEDTLNSSLGEDDGKYNGALVAIDPSTGHVKAMVGGSNWDKGQNNLATGDANPGDPGRPCGSSFKTFTLLAALEAGISPETNFDCTSPATIPNTEYKGTSALKNIDNVNYGTRSIKRGFAVSSNTGFVRLEMALGVDKVYEMAKRLGITSQLSESAASLTLGAFNVSMLDMATAYSAIANGGTHYDAQPVLQIKDGKGEVVFDSSAPEGERVLEPEVAHAATEVMKGVVNTSEGTGQAAALPNGQPVAAKTGTSSDYKDITFCGITPQLSVSVWFGDVTNKLSLPEHTSAADVFRNFTSEALYGREVQDFPDAGDPEYKSYSNDTYHIGSYSGKSSSGGSSSGGSSSGDDTRKEEPTEEKPTTPPTPTEPTPPETPETPDTPPTDPPTEPETPPTDPPTEPETPPTDPPTDPSGGGTTPASFALDQPLTRWLWRPTLAA